MIEIRQPMTVGMIALEMRCYYLTQMQKEPDYRGYRTKWRGCADSTIRRLVALVRDWIESSDYDAETKSEYLPFYVGKVAYYPAKFVKLVFDQKQIPCTIATATESAA